MDSFSFRRSGGRTLLFLAVRLPIESSTVVADTECNPWSCSLCCSDRLLGRIETHHRRDRRRSVGVYDMQYTARADIFGCLCIRLCSYRKLDSILRIKYTSLSGWASLLSLVVTLVLWKAQFQSTWCFFAAILSFIIVLSVWNELQEYQPSTKSRPSISMDQNDLRKSDLVVVDEV